MKNLLLCGLGALLFSVSTFSIESCSVNLPSWCYIVDTDTFVTKGSYIFQVSVDCRDKDTDTYVKLLGYSDLQGIVGAFNRSEIVNMPKKITFSKRTDGNLVMNLNCN